jgi:hypothetical protein
MRGREKKGEKRRGCEKMMRGREKGGGVGLGPLGAWSRSLTSNNCGA